MCMITYLEPGVEVPSKEIWNGATWNDDGHGWAVAAEIGLMLTGKFLDIETALETFEATRAAYPDSPALFHSRWATHGSICARNAHPFPVGPYAVMAHNGVMPARFQPQGNDDRTDSAIFADRVLPGKASASGVWTRKARRRISRLITPANKLVILSVSPKLEKPTGYVINASQGYWDYGVWYSNRDYMGAWAPKRHTSSPAIVTDVPSGVCPICHTNEDVDSVVNTCLRCDICLDCYEPTRACLCWTPAESRWMS